MKAIIFWWRWLWYHFSYFAYSLSWSLILFFIVIHLLWCLPHSWNKCWECERIPTEKSLKPTFFSFQSIIEIQISANLPAILKAHISFCAFILIEKIFMISSYWLRKLNVHWIESVQNVAESIRGGEGGEQKERYNEKGERGRFPGIIKLLFNCHRMTVKYIYSEQVNFRE